MNLLVDPWYFRQYRSKHIIPRTSPTYSGSDWNFRCIQAQILESIIAFERNERLATMISLITIAQRHPNYSSECAEIDLPNHNCNNEKHSTGYPLSSTDDRGRELPPHNLWYSRKLKSRESYLPPRVVALLPITIPISWSKNSFVQLQTNNMQQCKWNFQRRQCNQS